MSARIEVDRLNETLGLGIPDGSYETLAGFLLHYFGRIPRVGDSTEVPGALLTVANCTSRSIDEVDIVVQVRPGDPPPDGPSSTGAI